MCPLPVSPPRLPATSPAERIESFVSGIGIWGTMFFKYVEDHSRTLLLVLPPIICCG